MFWLLKDNGFPELQVSSMVDYLDSMDEVVVPFSVPGGEEQLHELALPTPSLQSLPTEWLAWFSPAHGSTFQFPKTPEMFHVPYAGCTVLSQLDTS